MCGCHARGLERATPLLDARQVYDFAKPIHSAKRPVFGKAVPGVERHRLTSRCKLTGRIDPLRRNDERRDGDWHRLFPSIGPPLRPTRPTRLQPALPPDRSAAAL